EIALSRDLPLVGAVMPRHSLTLPIAAPSLSRRRASFLTPESFFAPDGLSLVAGRAALVPASGSPALVAANAAQAGAAAVLLYGAQLPAGGIGLDEETPIPVVAVPSAVAARMINALSRGADASASIGAAGDAATRAAAAVAP